MTASQHQVDSMTNAAGNGPTDFPFGLSLGTNLPRDYVQTTSALGGTISAATPVRAQYVVLGKWVIVFGNIGITFTGAGSGNFSVDLPSDAQPTFTAGGDVGGAGTTQGGEGVLTVRDGANHVEFATTATGAGGRSLGYVFMYKLP